MSKRFDIDEANHMIPRLERALERMQELVREARRRHREKDLIKAVGYDKNGRLIMAVDYEEAETALQQAVAELDGLIEGIQAEGCQIKDIERGLIDFPAVIDGEEVLLCWEMGEKRIAYYHDYRSGYAGRRPLDPDE